MAKKTNQFAAPSEGVQAGAPVETPAPTVRVKRDGTPFKVRGPSGPRTVNPKVTEFKAAAKKALDEFMAEQQAGLAALQKSIELEARTAKAATKMEATLLKLNPEEQAWLLKANA